MSTMSHSEPRGRLLGSDPLKPCVLIPVFNHEEPIGPIVERLVTLLNIPILLINDGSSDRCRERLKALAASHEQVELLNLPVNRGKGGALKEGFRHALQRGFTHALQIDADGQHDTGDAALFFQQAQAHPDAIICGCPIYDDSVPALRFYARYLTHVWIWINSVSLAVKDSMCGYRVYPLASTVALINAEATGNRMDFDSEIMVRWVWRDGVVINQPTRVTYPEDGISHFAPWRDNYLISKMHATLFFGMLIRLPRIVRRRWQRNSAHRHGLPE